MRSTTLHVRDQFIRSIVEPDSKTRVKSEYADRLHAKTRYSPFICNARPPGSLREGKFSLGESEMLMTRPPEFGPVTMRVQKPMMGRRRTLYGEGLQSPEQIVRKLREAEGKLSGGAKVPEVARDLGVSEATFHRSGESSTVLRARRRPSASRSLRRRTPA